MQPSNQAWVIYGQWVHSQVVYSDAWLWQPEGATTVHTYVFAVVEASPLGSIHMNLTTASALHHSPHYSSRQAILCSVRLQDISSITQVRLLKPCKVMAHKYPPKLYYTKENTVKTPQLACPAKDLFRALPVHACWCTSSCWVVAVQCQRGTCPYKATAHHLTHDVHHTHIA